MRKKIVILGGGISGLALGCASQSAVYEADNRPGGICSSYYMYPNSKERLSQAPNDEEAYRFELGGGHWIFGADPEIRKFISSLVPVKEYLRCSSVYFSGIKKFVPYPLQNNLRFLDEKTAKQVIKEVSENNEMKCVTMQEWLKTNFGPTLCDLFFYPFHKLYTSNLYEKISFQDSFKTPLERASIIQGAVHENQPAGYNATFIYPEQGLNVLAEKMAKRCDIHYGKYAEKVDPCKKEIFFRDGSVEKYEKLITTLPLNKMIDMAGIKIDPPKCPYTSVLVLNIGATKGQSCPVDHWVYSADSKSGFHRVGFYSNVEVSFLPRHARKNQDRVSIYVERSFPGGMKPSQKEIEEYSKRTVTELKDWGFIDEVEVADPTWIDVAYTWEWPGSKWKELALNQLAQYCIQPIGRYGRWKFQGIAESIKEGLAAGISIKNEH